MQRYIKKSRLTNFKAIIFRFFKLDINTIMMYEYIVYIHIYIQYIPNVYIVYIVNISHINTF